MLSEVTGPAILAFLLAIVLTPAVRGLARQYGVVANPKPDRWHTKPTAMLGGAAIFGAVLIAYLLAAERTTNLSLIVGASALMFAVGLIDDFAHIKAYQKLIGQILAASILVYFGMVMVLTGSYAFNALITLFWVIGITNAVNMLDNMDGLAAGVAAIASAFLGVNFWANGQSAEAIAIVILAAALVGFLIYNSNPASIFMGDCGSMFIGFFLAAAALLNHTGGRSRTVLPVLAVPILIFLIPIFDTTFVTLLRKLSGRPASQGGRDHTSHRLVALGMSERRAVWMLHGLAVAAGLLSMVIRNVQIDVGIAIMAVATLSLTLLGVLLAEVRVYEKEVPQKIPAAVAFLADLSYKRRIFEVLLDLILISLSYYFAHLIVLGPVAGTWEWGTFANTLPIVISIKMGVFWAAGAYRGIWRYLSVESLFTFARAVILGSAFTVLTLFALFGLGRASRTVFLIDALLLLTAVLGTRLTFRLVRQLLPFPKSDISSRVLIFGAGDAGDLLFRELRNNPAWACEAVGFLDDDERKVRKVLHGLTIFHAERDFRTVCERYKVHSILVSTRRVSGQRLASLAADCSAAGVTLQQMAIVFEAIALRPEPHGVELREAAASKREPSEPLDSVSSPAHG